MWVYISGGVVAGPSRPAGVAFGHFFFLSILASSISSSAHLQILLFSF